MTLASYTMTSHLLGIAIKRRPTITARVEPSVRLNPCALDHFGPLGQIVFDDLA